MLVFHEGFPLWSPQLDASLHVEYRTTGVTVGDVGIITLDGGFDIQHMVASYTPNPSP